MHTQLKCPCGRPKPYESCCSRIHKDITQAKTAEDMMRSRYSAFVLANVDYLFKSHYPTKTLLLNKADILAWTKSVKWLGLEIINKSEGEPSDSEGTVEFKAHYEENFKRTQIHENSRFVRYNRAWVYYDAL